MDITHKKRFLGLHENGLFLSLVLMVIIFFVTPPVMANTPGSPSDKIKISKEEMRISELIKLIEEQTDYLIVFSNNDIDTNQTIKVRKGELTVQETLNLAFGNIDIEFTFDNNYITLRKKRNTANTQSRVQIDGIIKDSNNEPLIGVNVSVKGKSSVAITGIDGKFSAEVDKDNILVFSYVGFKNKEIKVGNTLFFDVLLNENIEELETVVITGYGDFKKSTYTGAASVISMDKLQDIPVISTTQMLESQVPGLRINSSSNQPGAYKNMSIRGIGSINASNQPLIVLDGVPIIDANYVNDADNSTGLDAFSTINPNDIESITVLKDATSTSIYGARGSNGVILITTKKGKEGKTRVTAKSSFSYSDFATKYRPRMGGMERRELLYEGYVNEALEKGKSEIEAVSYANSEIDKYGAIPTGGFSDWEDAMTKTGVQQNYDISVSGGNANTNFVASLGYINDKGVVISSMFHRYSARLALNHKYKNFDLSTNAMLSITENDAAREGYFFTSPLYAWVCTLTPSIPIYKEDGSLNYNYPQMENGGYNPIMEETMNERYNKVSRFLGNITAGYQIFDFLRLSTVFGYEYSNTREFKYYSPESKDGMSDNGFGSMSSPTMQRIISNSRLTYNQKFGNHQLNAIAAFELFSHSYESFSGAAKGYSQLVNHGLSNASTPTAVNQYPPEYDRMLSWVGIVNYNFADKYYLSGSFRNDASSRLAIRSANFWSLSGSWKITQEPFLKATENWLSDAKIKVSYGVNGTLPNGWYSHLSLYSATNQYGDENAISESTLGNSRLTWEKGYNLNLGLEFSLFNRVNAELNFYQRDTKNLLMSDPLPGHIGFTSQIRNFGHIRNRGIEVGVNSVNIQNKDFRWTTNLSLASNNTTVVKTNTAGADLRDGWFILQEGKPYLTYYILEFAGVNPDNGKAQYYYNHDAEDGSYSKRDITENVREAQRTPYKNAEEKLTGSLTNTLSYKMFDLSFMFSFSLGGHSLDTETWGGEDDGKWAMYTKSIKLRNRWQKPGDKTDVPRYVNNYENGGYFTTSRAIHSTDHLRLKNISIGFRPLQKWVKSVGLESARIYIAGSNLLTFAKYKDYDPELGRVVGFSIPPLKTLSFGIELNF